MKPKLLLIDGDIYAYLYAAAAEKAYDWGDGLWTLFADEGVAWDNMQADINSTLATLNADKLVVTLSSPKSFRKELVYPEYKSNRKDTRKPMILKALREHMLNCFESVQIDGLEADDVMGIMATDPSIYPDYDKIIVSADKDMRTIPAVIWNGKFDLKGKPDLIYVDEAEADYRFMLQTLTGDATDGYPGCPGMGPKTAEKLLLAADISTRLADISLISWRWKYIVEAYEKKGLTEEFALSQARCARILRATDFDKNKKEPILWNPR